MAGHGRSRLHKFQKIAKWHKPVQEQTKVTSRHGESLSPKSRGVMQFDRDSSRERLGLQRSNIENKSYAKLINLVSLMKICTTWRNLFIPFIWKVASVAVAVTVSGVNRGIKIQQVAQPVLIVTFAFVSIQTKYARLSIALSIGYLGMRN